MHVFHHENKQTIILFAKIKINKNKRNIAICMLHLTLNIIFPTN